jgi:hypothetical protein
MRASVGHAYRSSTKGIGGGQPRQIFWGLLHLEHGNRNWISHLCSKTLRCLQTISSVWS